MIASWNPLHLWMAGLHWCTDTTSPMDLATMARKVKNKAYKSKREFKDDLDLIWSNCYKYNTEVRFV